MITSVLAKFKITSITKALGYGGKDNFLVKLNPVYADSAENRQFWQSTPSGNIELTVLAPGAVEFFDAAVGQEIYVTFSKEKPE